jgi:hypothetical protein
VSGKAADFSAKLERKWANEQRQLDERNARQVAQTTVEDEPPQAVVVHDPANEDGPAPLEPRLATVSTLCRLCCSYIERGEAIVSADGVTWVHAACAETAGWSVA